MKRPALPGRVVLVLQGGGALGAYHVGVYEALQEAGIEPDWVIGTSIGAINGAIIAGNAPKQRIARLREFWERVERNSYADGTLLAPWFAQAARNFGTLTMGVPGFFGPNPAAAWGLQARIGVDRAAFYSTAALRASLGELVEFERVKSGETRFTVGAVNVRSGEMHYFDSRNMTLLLEHVLASSALPPVFPAVLIDGEPYWDGGVYSNTPIEAVFDDSPRRDSLVFAVQVWRGAGVAPDSIWQVLARQKEIQYASRNKSHIARQEQIHHLRHVIRELAQRLPESQQRGTEVEALAAYGCGTFMHIVQLNAPSLDGDEYTRDIDFSPAGISARRQAGYADARNVLQRRPWDTEIDAMAGVAVYDSDDPLT